MVQVVEYQPGQETLRPSHRSSIDVRATPDMFGAQQGQALGEVARGLSKVADAASFVQDLDDTNAAKDALNGLSNDARDMTYGENGYVSSTEGANAVNGFGSYRERLEKAALERGKGLTGQAGAKYKTASDAMVQSNLDTGIRHQGQQRKQWTVDTGNATLDAISNDAAVKYTDQVAIDQAMSRGKAEIDHMGYLKGWSAEEKQQETLKFSSTLNSNIIKRRMADDPIQAQKYYDDNKQYMSANDQYQTETVLKGAVLDRQGQNAVDGFHSSTTRSYAAPSDNSYNAGNSEWSGTLSNFIGGGESQRYGYNALVYGDKGAGTPNSGNVTTMSIGQVLDYQAGMSKRGHASSGVGKFQVLQGSLFDAANALGLDVNQPFDEPTQEKVGKWLADRRGLSKWKAGQMSDATFLAGMKKEWPSLAKQKDADILAAARDGFGAADAVTNDGSLGSPSTIDNNAEGGGEDNSGARADPLSRRRQRSENQNQEIDNAPVLMPKQGFNVAATPGTAAKKYLITRSSHGGYSVDGLNDGFAQNVAAMLQDVPAQWRPYVGLLSGARTEAQGKALFAASDGTGRTVAKPGGSLHQDHGQGGMAIDIGWKDPATGKWSGLGSMPAGLKTWLHQNAGRYGNYFPMAWENWHMEPVQTYTGRGIRGDAGASAEAKSQVAQARSLGFGGSNGAAAMPMMGGGGAPPASQTSQQATGGQDQQRTSNGGFPIAPPSLVNYSLPAGVPGGPAGAPSAGPDNTGGPPLSGKVVSASPRPTGQSQLPSMDQVQDYLDSIPNLEVRERARKGILAKYELQGKAEEADQKQAQEQAWAILQQPGTTPDDLPPQLRQQVGMAFVSSAYEFTNKRLTASGVKTDPSVYNAMVNWAAGDPEGFGKYDLNMAKSTLSEQDFRKFSDMQGSVRQDARKAQLEGFQVNTILSQADSQLKAVGLGPPAVGKDENQEIAKQRAVFQNAVIESAEQFKAKNDRYPNSSETQGIINELLRPIVISAPQEQSFFSLFGGGIGSGPTVGQTPGYLFQTRNMADGATYTGASTYEDIPRDIRQRLTLSLRQKFNGRNPTQSEVAAMYNNISGTQGGAPAGNSGQ